MFRLRKLIPIVCSFLFFFICLLIPALSHAENAAPKCVPSAPDGYPEKTCIIVIDRDNPASPTPLAVHGGTKVIVRVKHARENENVSFSATTAAVPPNDVAGTFIKSAVSPLQGLVLHIQNYVLQQHVPLPEEQPKTSIAADQQTILSQLDGVSLQIANASTELTCLEAYKPVDQVKDNDNQFNRCSADKNLTAATFATAKTTAINNMKDAAKAKLPLDASQRIDQKLKDAKDDSLGQELTTQALINNLITDIQKAQTALYESAEQLSNLADAPSTVEFPITEPRDRNSTVTVAATEVLSKTTTPLANFTISWQSNPWEVSTGIFFSMLTARTFSNNPLFSNGQPVLDSSGKNLTQVAESDTTPSVIFPMVMVNYRIAKLSRWKWEYACPNHCAILVSGGIGLDLTSKTTAFAAGPSFQIGEVLLTPAVHVGRETQLSEGVKVGDQFGSSPPSPLPTGTGWVPGFAIGISYILPFQ